MVSALARHDSILSGAIERARGRVLKTTGDGAIAVFDSAPEAVAATLDAQRALSAESSDSTGPLRVRMGLHVGETESRDDDHFGPVMNGSEVNLSQGWFPSWFVAMMCPWW